MYNMQYAAHFDHFGAGKCLSFPPSAHIYNWVLIRIMKDSGVNMN